MSWVRVDDKLLGHPWAIRAGIEAIHDRYEDRVSISFEEAEYLIKWMWGRQ